MPDYLATKDWKSVLDLKENKSVKKTGISETLDDYASAKKKNDIGKMVSALERIVQKATEVKSAQKDRKSIADFLAETIKAAKTEQQKLAVQLDNKDTDEDNEDSTLGKGLTRLKQVQDLDSAWNFILVPGKPSSGFVVSKKPIKKENMVKAFEMRGKRAPFFTGRIYFEGGKYVLQLEDKPLPGLAKAAKGAATLHAEMTAKFVVRGAGVELDSDTDIEPQEEGGAPEHLRDEGRFSGYKSRVTQVGTVVTKFETSPNAKVDGAGDGINGAIKVLYDQIEGDTALTDNMKLELLSDLDAYILRMAEAAKPVAEDPAAKYPDKAYWVRLGDAIIRLDPSRRDDAWDKYSARLREVKTQFDNDTALVDPKRGQVAGVLQEAVELLRTAERYTVGLFEQGNETGNSELAQRMKSLERRYDQMMKTEGLVPQQVENVGKAYRMLRAAFANGDLDPKDLKIGQVEVALETMAQRAFAKQQETARTKGQQEMHESLSKGMEFMKRAALPTGLIKDPTAIRDQIQTNPELGGMIAAMSKATKTPGKDGGAEMEKTARALLAKVDPKSDLGQLAAQVLARGAMMRMVDEYTALGNPPWDPAKADLASELQAQLFFLEGSIAQGVPNYEAPRLGGGQSGASGSWWIERQEKGKPGEETKGKKKYIFKPGKEEASVMTGLLPGSGAPREVLAKRLDEMMSGAGFDVGVSPTTLAKLDSAQLGDMDGPGGPQLGSMQQLAPSDGSIGDKLEDLKEFSKTIDKKSFDDNAVFDMLYANLDRHAKNMLFATDPDTGKVKMVPIDHGSALPDPESLQCNRASLMPGFNIMADKDMVPAQAPLGDETVEALMRLDPAKMVQDMKQSRDELANRHPETAGLMSDEAIDAMAARVHFVRAAAAAKVPVAEIFEMLALGALRIAKAGPQDMAGLVITLHQEVTDAAQGREEAEEIWSAFKDANGGMDIYLIMGVLGDLGWGWSLSKTGFHDWVNDNPKLVARVMKTRQVNPAIQKEIARLLPLAKAKDPEIETKSKKFDLVKQYNTYFDVAYGDVVKGPARETPIDSLKQMFETLGGLATLKKAAAVFPSDCAKYLTEPDPSRERAHLNGWIGRVAALRQWQMFEAEGGMPEILRLGGTIRRETNIKDGIMRLAELKEQQAITKDLLDLDEDEVDEKIAGNYASMMVEIKDILDEMRGQDNILNLTTIRDEGKSVWEKGNAGGAVAVLSRGLILGRDRLADERGFIIEATDRKNKLQQQFDTLDPNLQDSLRPHMPGILKLADDSIATCALKYLTDAENQFKVRADMAAKGDESDYRRFEVALAKQIPRVNAHAGKPWHAALTALVTKIQQLMGDFDLKNLDNSIPRLAETVDAMNLINDALGNADLNALPEEATKIIEDWKVRIGNYSGINKAPEAAEQLARILQPALN